MRAGLFCRRHHRERGAKPRLYVRFRDEKWRGTLCCSELRADLSADIPEPYRADNEQPQVLTDPKPIPPEIDRWNWGAFLLNWIWGVGNNTFIALLTLIPIVGFVMLFVLGAKGSRWAWRNGRWDSVEHFKRVQRLWAIWGVIIWFGGIALFGAYSAVFFPSSDIPKLTNSAYPDFKPAP